MGSKLFLFAASRGKEVRIDTFTWSITGAKAASPLPVDDSTALIGFDAITQTQIDDFLGSTDEFPAAAFDATAMGDDMFAAIFNLQGQASELVMAKAYCYSGTAGSTLVERAFEDSATLTDSTLITECAKSSLGNVAVKVDYGNVPDFDALTSGIIQIDLHWRTK